MTIALIIIIGLIVVAGLFVMVLYNRLVGMRNKVRNAWSQIDVQMKRRFDLIPNLIETVKGYAAHEKGTFDMVTQARTKFMSLTVPEDKIKANTELTNALGKLFAVAEAYPDLKANQNFLELQTELSDTEDKISFARQFYNDVVMDFNNGVQMFPSSLIAGMFNFKAEPFFQIDESEKAAPQVKF